MQPIILAPDAQICIMRLSAIGDVCHALSSVQAIQRRYPQAKITWVIGKVEYQLLKGLAGIEFIIFDKSLGIKGYQQLRHAMRDRQFDVLLHMQLALRANLAAFFIPAKRKIGFEKSRAKELHSLFVNHHISDSRGFHVLDGFRDFARAIDVEDSPPSWDFVVESAITDWADAQLPKKPYMIISPAASKAERDWLTERYATIADYCAEQELTVIITGSPSQREQDLAKAIMEHCQSEPINLVGKTNLKQLLYTLKNARLVLAPDSGPAHMAVTQSTPVIGLYAHSNPKRTGPYSYLNLVQDAYSANASAQSGKSNDQLDWGFRLKGAELMAQISTEQVINTIKRVLETSDKEL